MQMTEKYTEKGTNNSLSGKLSHQCCNRNKDERFQSSDVQTRPPSFISFSKAIQFHSPFTLQLHQTNWAANTSLFWLIKVNSFNRSWPREFIRWLKDAVHGFLRTLRKPSILDIIIHFSTSGKQHPCKHTIFLRLFYHNGFNGIIYKDHKEV